MMSIFKHLSVIDLLRACRVCKIWRRMALQKCLWRKLDLRQLGNIVWAPAFNFFLNVDVRTLIMPEPILPSKDGFETLYSIIDGLSRLTQLKEVHFGIISQTMIDRILDKMPNLRNLGVDFIVDTDPGIASHTPSNSSSSEMAMTRAVDLVLSGGLSVSEAALLAGVLEADLAHLTQQNQGVLRKLEQDSVLLGCMRLCQMGFVVDEAVIHSRLEEIVKKRSTTVKMTEYVRHLVAERMFRNNHHLFQTNLPYQKHDCLVQKLKGYANSLGSFYNEVGLRSSNNVLAFVVKEFKVLNGAGNKMHTITALSVISPANLSLPIMLIFPVSVYYPECPPGLILISSKDGMPTANLVMHYLRAVFESVSARPLIIFFNGHENLLSLELVSECIEKRVLLHCIPKELSETIFPGNYGGFLHSLSKKIGTELMVEKKFIQFISFHLKVDWWANWQGMCRAFQVTGIFPFSPSAAIGLYRSILSDTLDSHLKGVEIDCDEDSSSSSSSSLSSDEESDEEETEMNQTNESATKSEEYPTTAENKEEMAQSQNDKCERKSSHNEKSPQGHPSVDLKVNETLGHLHSVPASNADQRSERKRKRSGTTDDDDDDDDDDDSVADSESTDSCGSEAEAPDIEDDQKLIIHIDEDEKEKKNTTDEKDNINSTDEKEKKNTTDEKDNIHTTDEKEKKNTTDEKDNINTTDEKESKNTIDEKENNNIIESPPRKKKKLQGPSKDISSIDSLIATIDSVIASSREYYDECQDGKTLSSSSSQIIKKDKENKAQHKPPLKLTLFPKSNVSDFKKVQISPFKKGDIESGLINVKESESLHENTNSIEISEDEESDKDDEMEEENEELNDDDSEMKEADEASQRLSTAKEEASLDENESDEELKASDQELPSVHDKEILETSTTTRWHKKKKKRKKKKNTKEKEDKVARNIEKDDNYKESSSKKKKKKKRKKKKSSKEHEDDINDIRVVVEKVLVEETDLNTDEISLDSKDTEKSMNLMRRISLADHDYEAKFDSDSGHELEITEEKAYEESRISETGTSTKNEIQGGEHNPDPDKLPAQETEDSKDGTSESSSDSESSKKSGSGSSSSSSSSSDDSSSDSSSSDEDDTSDSKKVVEGESSESETDDDKDENSSSDDEASQSEDENQSSGEKKENQSDDSDSKSDGNQSEDEADTSDDGSELNQSEDETSSKANSNEELYSEDDDEDDNMQDDDSKCQLCMSSNPPHSKDQIINWVDCDSNCGRWFHVICINRSQSKANPKHFVCPSCRCRR